MPADAGATLSEVVGVTLGDQITVAVHEVTGDLGEDASIPLVECRFYFAECIAASA